MGDVADPKLPANTMDLVLLVDVYHELAQPQQMLRKIREILKPDGRLVLLEYRAEDPNVPIVAEHKMTVAQVKTELEAEGFVLHPVIETLPRQHILILTKAAARPRDANSCEARAEAAERCRVRSHAGLWPGNAALSGRRSLPPRGGTGNRCQTESAEGEAATFSKVARAGALAVALASVSYQNFLQLVHQALWGKTCSLLFHSVASSGYTKRLGAGKARPAGVRRGSSGCPR